MRWLVTLIALLLAGAAVSFEHEDSGLGDPPVAWGVRPTDPVCAVGCSDPAAPPDLPRGEFEELLRACAGRPFDPDNEALEALLFHGARALARLDEAGPGPLDAAEERALRRELGRTRALLEVRVVNAHGEVRTELSEWIPLGEKQHLFPAQAVDVQVPEISGTVRRVGVKHLWARL